LHFSDIIVAHNWLKHRPLNPIISQGQCTVSENDTIEFISPPYRPHVVQTVHKWSRYQLSFDSTNWHLPLFDSDTGYRFRDTLKIYLNVPEYTPLYWRVKHVSVDGAESDWSSHGKVSLTSGKKNDSTIIVKSAFFSKIGKSKRVDVLEKNVWYDLIVEYERTLGSSQPAYLLFWASNEKHTTGHIGNKGSTFQPTGRYIFNMSRNRDLIHEKYVPGTTITRVLDTMGLYCDASNGHYSFDTATGIVRLRVKLLPEANVGKWSLRGVAWNNSKRASVIHFSEFVVDEKKVKSRFLFIFLLLSPVVFVSVWVFLKRKKKSEVPADNSRYNDIIEAIKSCVEKNRAKNIGPTEVEQQTGIRYSLMHEAVKTVFGTGLKNYIIQLKIHAAAAMLKETNLNVSEVMSRCGFNDLSYFTRTFKVIIGTTPKKYQLDSRK
jgi:AraC-like DNA-binding protein